MQRIAYKLDTGIVPATIISINEEEVLIGFENGTFITTNINDKRICVYDIILAKKLLIKEYE